MEILIITNNYNKSHLCNLAKAIHDECQICCISFEKSTDPRATGKSYVYDNIKTVSLPRIGLMQKIFYCIVSQKPPWVIKYWSIEMIVCM